MLATYVRVSWRTWSSSSASLETLKQREGDKNAEDDEQPRVGFVLGVGNCDGVAGTVAAGVMGPVGSDKEYMAANSMGSMVP